MRIDYSGLFDKKYSVFSTLNSGTVEVACLKYENRTNIINNQLKNNSL